MCAVLMLFIDMTLENNLHKKNDFSFYNVFLEHFRIYLRILEIFQQLCICSEDTPPPLQRPNLG